MGAGLSYMKRDEAIRWGLTDKVRERVVDNYIKNGGSFLDDIVEKKSDKAEGES